MESTKREPQENAEPAPAAPAAPTELDQGGRSPLAQIVVLSDEDEPGLVCTVNGVCG